MFWRRKKHTQTVSEYHKFTYSLNFYDNLCICSILTITYLHHIFMVMLLGIRWASLEAMVSSVSLQTYTVPVKFCLNYLSIILTPPFGSKFWQLVDSFKSQCQCDSMGLKNGITWICQNVCHRLPRSLFDCCGFGSHIIFVNLLVLWFNEGFLKRHLME